MRFSLLPICLLVIAACVGAKAAERLVDVRWTDAPLDMVLGHYGEVAGKSVEVVKGVNGKVTLATDKPVRESEFLKLIENQLRDQNIALFPITSNRVVAAWITPPPQESEPEVDSVRKESTPLRPIREKRIERIRRVVPAPGN